MNKEELWQQFSSLPPEGQQEFIDFMEGLRAYCENLQASGQPIDFSKDPIVGMWADREDMKDSIAWVRRLREHEWGVQHDTENDDGNLNSPL